MIVDASVAVKWLVREDGADEALALLGRMDLIAPTLIHAEVANAVWKKRRRGEFNDDVDLETLPDRLATVIQTTDETPVLRRALQMAISIDHPVHDCVYVAPAELSGDRVFTADERFIRKVRRSELGRFVVRLEDIGQ